MSASQSSKTPESLTWLYRGVSEIFPNQPDSEDTAENLAQRLARIDRPLRVKYGIDPTGAEVHLGHTIPMRKLRGFQDAGHIAVLIIGDFTARIGDPTGKSDVRRQLSAEEVAHNAKTYLDQIRPILDFSPERLEIRYNSEWLQKLDLAEIQELLATMTVGQMLAKEGFSERYDTGNPIYLHEFLYPLMQGYDSVAVSADVELGGTDQKFNIAIGRDLQRHFNQLPQFGLLMPILLGTDGEKKMSKSLGNYVGLSEDPLTMYSKLEKTPDHLIEQYFELLTARPLDQLPEKPRLRQQLLALDIAAQYHSMEAALKALRDALVLVQGDASQAMALKDYYSEDSAFAQLLTPRLTQGQPDTQASTVPEFSLSKVEFPAKLFYILSASSLCKSSSDARRQIQGGAVKLEGHVIEQVELTFDTIDQLEGATLSIGKKRFVRLVR